MLVIFVRALILYTLFLIVMRLMGKRQIGEMQPFEFIITLLIAELACIPMTDISIPLTYGIVSLLAIFILHQIMSLIERLGDKVKFLISGKPSIVITPNGIDFDQLKKNNLSVSDLSEALRVQGFFSFDDVLYAIFESNGKLSVLENSKRENGGLPLILINEGKVVKSNFAKRKTSVEQIEKFLNKRGFKIENIMVLTLDESGRIYLQKRKLNYQILQFNWNE